MTIRDKSSIASAPTEDEVIVNAEPVTDMYGAGTNINVPFAHATPSAEIELQQSSYYASNPRASDAVPTAYSTGAPPQHPRPQPPARGAVAVATGAPVIRASTQTATADNQRRQNQDCQDCCNGQTCCCVTTIVLMVVFICCILPVIIVIIAGLATVNSVLDSNITWDDDFWNVTDEFWNVTNTWDDDFWNVTDEFWNVTNTTLNDYDFDKNF